MKIVVPKGYGTLFKAMAADLVVEVSENDSGETVMQFALPMQDCGKFLENLKDYYLEKVEGFCQKDDLDPTVVESLIISFLCSAAQEILATDGTVNKRAGELVQIGFLVGRLSAANDARPAERAYINGVNILENSRRGADATRLPVPSKESVKKKLDDLRQVHQKESIVDSKAAEFFSCKPSKFRQWKKDYGLLKKKSE